MEQYEPLPSIELDENLVQQMEALFNDIGFEYPDLRKKITPFVLESIVSRLKSHLLGLRVEKKTEELKEYNARAAELILQLESIIDAKK